ncbi:hypothetical protein MVEN_02292100 [Mycena venus]|uniref:Uncharacterized protein n=1 Tax=Mycena venus TaxID=2733690 RepID=A0A8H6X5J1_9AGAR|nr:hypothetical protein MVEN_02292100 [Mycena venus]
MEAEMGASGILKVLGNLESGATNYIWVDTSVRRAFPIHLADGAAISDAPNVHTSWIRLGNDGTHHLFLPAYHKGLSSCTAGSFSCKLITSSTSGYDGSMMNRL